MKILNEPVTSKEKVDKAVDLAMKIYCQRLQDRYYPVELEATFQFYFARILETLLDTMTYDPKESYQVLLEDCIPIGDHDDYVDIVVIRRYETSAIEQFFIELKFKKIKHSAYDLGVVESYKDIQMLDRHMARKHCTAAYFIFLTDCETYLKPSKRGTRAELPMHDGAKIEANKTYTVSGKSARKAMSDFPDGFLFNTDHIIEYTGFSIDAQRFSDYTDDIIYCGKDKEFWYFMLCI